MDDANKKISIYKEWMIGGLFSAAAEIESEVFCDPWYESDFRKMMKQRGNLALVAKDCTGTIVGYIAWQLRPHHDCILILRMATHPALQRRGVGEFLVNELKSKLSIEGRRRLAITVRESNDAGQAFFAAQGFRATSIVRHKFLRPGGGDEDGYKMQYYHQSRIVDRSKVDLTQPKNRIARYLS